MKNLIKSNINSFLIASSLLLYSSCKIESKENMTKTTVTSSKQIAVKNKLWSTGQQIDIYLLNGSIENRELFKLVVDEFALYVNLDLVLHMEPENNPTPHFYNDDKIFVDLEAKLPQGVAGSSWVGTDYNHWNVSKILKISPHATKGHKLRGTMLHEFGHALGLKHEHQHPDTKIKNQKKICSIKDIKKKESCEKNHILTSYDKKSIMHYTFAFQDVPEVNELSDKDIQFLNNLYPFKKNSKNTNILRSRNQYWDTIVQIQNEISNQCRIEKIDSKHAKLFLRYEGSEVELTSEAPLELYKVISKSKNLNLCNLDREVDRSFILCEAREIPEKERLNAYYKYIIVHSETSTPLLVIGDLAENNLISVLLRAKLNSCFRTK